MVLEVRDLSLTIKGKNILNSISFSIDKKDIVCLCGKNGAGKTNLLRCIIGTEKRYKGKISFLDTENRKDILHKIGSMIGGPSLYSYLSGRENLDIIRRYYGLSPNAIAETLDIAGLSSHDKKSVAFYSSGMKQRLAIAMAFIHKPSIVILDEPLNSLDPQAIVDVRELILKLNSEFHTTFIITSHSLDEISKIFSKLFILRNGSLILNGSRESLLNFGRMTGTFNSIPDQFYDSGFKKSGIFCKIGPKEIKMVGEKSRLFEVKNNFATDITWSTPETTSIEDIYLTANASE